MPNPLASFLPKSRVAAAATEAYTPLLILAKQLHLPAYALYRIVVRLNLAYFCDREALPFSSEAPIGKRLPLLKGIMLPTASVQALRESLEQLKRGVHLREIEAQHAGLSNMPPVKAPPQALPKSVKTLHQQILDGQRWMPELPRAVVTRQNTPVPSPFRKGVRRATWAMPHRHTLRNNP